MPTTHLDPIQAGAQITRENFHWGTTLGAATGPITFGFRQSTTSNNDATEKNTFSPFTAQEKAAAEIVMHQWAALANISFTEVMPSSYTNSAAILFANYFSTTDGAQAYAYFPSSNNQAATSPQGDVWLNKAHESTTSLPFGSYDFMTLVHEIGHALGLDHPGDYNAGPGQTITYANNAEYVEDTLQYTVMSYFRASNTGANHVYNGQTVYASTPLLDDITAIQHLYGANTNYATGNTVYGFNSNADSAYHISSSTQQVVYCIWDGGGGDTLDCSGYSTNQLIDLIPGTFSNLGALTMNVSIALGTIIESAIGGSGNDTFYGNSANNIIDGHGGSDTVVFTGAHNQYLVTLAPSGSIQLADLRAGAPDGTDTLISIEFIQFSDGTYSVSQLNGASVSPVEVALTANFIGGPTSDALVVSYAGGTQTLFGDQIENNTLKSSTTIAQIGLDWKIDDAGDFDGDGDSDVLIHRDSGAARDYQIERMGPSGLEIALPVAKIGTEWFVDGTGDFNHDGDADVLLHKDIGTTRSFLFLDIQKNTVQQVLNGPMVGTDWQVDGIGDFNHDGTADIFMHRDVGDVRSFFVFPVHNDQASSPVLIANLGHDWQVEGVGDFNHDGNADLLIRQDSGGVRHLSILGFENGTPVEHPLATLGTDWHVEGIGDFNNDGTSDVLIGSDSGSTHTYATLQVVNDSLVGAPHAIALAGGDFLIG